MALLACGRVSFDAPTDASVVECGADARLIACFDFEGDAGDRSGHGNDAIGTGVEYVTGRFGRGMRMTDTSRADLTAPSLDTTAWTFDAWIRPALPAAGAEELIFDHDMRWAIMLDESAGSLVFGCNSAVDQGFVSMSLAPDVWAHVACIDDGTTLTGYVDGVAEVVGSGNGGGDTTIAAIGGNTPLTQEPSPYVGVVDRMRIWNAALPASELADP
jgi:hypothetical protein